MTPATLARLRELAAELTALLGDPTPGKAPPRREVAPGGAIGASDDLAPVPPAAQAVLPGLDGGASNGRTTQHRFGGFEARTFPAGPLAPEATVVNPVRLCRHCDCLHRVASAGPRLGKEDLYSTDGETWSRTSPPCIQKR